MQALSPEGRCKTLDSSADGYGRGEGCTVATIELVDHGNLAIAFICNTVVNQDGRCSSLTAPHGPSQAALITRALSNAGMR